MSEVLPSLPDKTCIAMQDLSFAKINRLEQRGDLVPTEAYTELGRIVFELMKMEREQV